MHSLTVKSSSREEFIDITNQVKGVITEAGVQDGIALVFTPHTTAAVTINENADPDVQRDLKTAFSSFGFDKLPFHHAEGNSPSHALSSLVGCSETIIIEEGRAVLGTWQGIYFCECEGPRNRRVFVKIIGR